jgi:CDP-paratose 2-epimerase
MSTKTTKTEQSGGRKRGSAVVSRAAAMTGVVSWFRVGEHDRVERVLEGMKQLGVRAIRTGVSWADACTKEGEEWYGWLLPRLAREVDVLPCFAFTPPHEAVLPRTSAPPRDPKRYADFLDVFVTRFGEHFDWVELWDAPNNLFAWDSRLDQDWLTFCTMLGGAAHWMRQRGKKTLLGGMSPIDPNWLRIMFERGVMQYIDAVGLHGFPGTREASWDGWRAEVGRVAQVLDEHDSAAQIWISETGYSTARNDERGQLRTFLDAIDAPVERVYWYELEDLHPEREGTSGFHTDEREYHFGLKEHDGTPKLLYRLWSQRGVEGVRDVYRLSAPVRPVRSKKRPVLITGGGGFIGSNLAHRLLSQREPVVLLDNLSRPGVEANVRALREEFGDLVQLELGDTRDRWAVRRAVAQASAVYHFAAQVAVTTSCVRPIFDSQVNVAGTLHVLEELRALKNPPPLVFTSTNKVYGALPDVGLAIRDDRYEPEDAALRSNGISEQRPLDLHSPYGCSKGAADQYILDYARTFGLPATVFRMSCIYGPRQLGNEDQGWVAHFLIRALEGQPITLYGDGHQVRDVLYVDDLVDAFVLARENIDRISGQAFNMGGGAKHTLSLLQLVDRIEDLTQRRPALSFEDWRPGDQRWYVSDTRKFGKATGWKARVDAEEGVARLHHWLSNRYASASSCSAQEAG